MQADVLTAQQLLRVISTYALDNGHDANDITVDGVTVGYDITNGVVVIAWLDRQMCIAQVLVSIPLSVWFNGTSTLVHAQLTHT